MIYIEIYYERDDIMKSSKVKRTIAVLAFIGIICICFYYGYMKNLVASYENLVYPGVSVEGIKISNKSFSEAIAIIKNKFSKKISDKKIYIRAEDKSYAFDYSNLKASYNINDAARKAVGYGKNKSFFDKFKTIKGDSNFNIKLKFDYDKNSINEIIKSIEKDVNKAPQNASINIGADSKVQIVKEVSGKKLNAKELQKNLINNINGSTNSYDYIDAPIEVVKPSITSETFSSIDAKISSFTTSFSGSSSGRANNIALAASSINNTFIAKDAEFSFNNTVGETSAARGYMEAPIIVGSNKETGIGGGICQVSTTLYNAVLRAGINPTERTHHTVPSYYVPLGQDATVSYGTMDFKFKNTLGFPIFLKGYVDKENIYFDVYSNSSLLQNKYDIVSEITETIKADTVYVNDNSIPIGETKEDPKNIVSDGYRVNVYRLMYTNGVLKSKDFLHKDYYAPSNKVILRGTKK